MFRKIKTTIDHPNLGERGKNNWSTDSALKNLNLLHSFQYFFTYEIGSSFFQSKVITIIAPGFFKFSALYLLPSLSCQKERERENFFTCFLHSQTFLGGSVGNWRLLCSVSTFLTFWRKERENLIRKRKRGKHCQFVFTGRLPVVAIVAP